MSKNDWSTGIVQDVTLEDVTLQDIARRVSEKIEKCGWIQGRNGSEADGYCLGGAFNEVMREDGLWTSIWETGVHMQFWSNVNYLIEAETGVKSMSVPFWNDISATTIEDVLLLVKKAGELE